MAGKGANSHYLLRDSRFNSHYSVKNIKLNHTKRNNNSQLYQNADLPIFEEEESSKQVFQNFMNQNNKSNANKFSPKKISLDFEGADLFDMLSQNQLAIEQ